MYTHVFPPLQHETYAKHEARRRIRAPTPATTRNCTHTSTGERTRREITISARNVHGCVAGLNRTHPQQVLRQTRLRHKETSPPRSFYTSCIPTNEHHEYEYEATTANHDTENLRTRRTREGRMLRTRTRHPRSNDNQVRLCLLKHDTQTKTRTDRPTR